MRLLLLPRACARAAASSSGRYRGFDQRRLIEPSWLEILSLPSELVSPEVGFLKVAEFSSAQMLDLPYEGIRIQPVERFQPRLAYLGLVNGILTACYPALPTFYRAFNGLLPAVSRPFAGTFTECVLGVRGCGRELDQSQQESLFSSWANPRQGSEFHRDWALWRNKWGHNGARIFQKKGIYD